MRLKEILNKFVNRKTPTYDLANIYANVYIPKRDEITDVRMLKLIDEYKNQCIDILSKDRHFFSNDLDSDKLKKRNQMYVDLLGYIFYKDEDTNSFYRDFKKGNSVDTVDTIIQTTKIDLYLNSISELDRKITARIIALKEILEKKTFSKRFRRDCIRNERIESIKNEIYNLSICLEIIRNQKTACEMEKESYLNLIDSKDDTILDEEEKELFLNDKLKKLLEIIKAIFPNGVYQLSSNVVLDIAIFEKMLEEYVYTHKTEIDKLYEELNELYQAEKTEGNREELLEKIKILEIKFKVFDEFGKNIVTDIDIHNLYSTKFEILTTGINKMSASPIDLNSDEKEIKTYQELVMKRIECIVTKCNRNLETIFDENIKVATLIIVNVLKEGKDKFNVNNILETQKLLAFLLAFDNERGLKKFFDECRVDNTILKYIFRKKSISDDYIIFENLVPYSTVFRIVSAHCMNEEEDEKNIFALFDIHNLYSIATISDGSEFEKLYMFNNIYNLYKIYRISRSYIPDENAYKVPEGIVEIDLDDMRIFNKELYNSLSIRSNAYIRVILPKSLKRISGEIPRNFNKNIVLNDGIEKISYTGVKNLRIIGGFPSSLKHIDSLALDHDALDLVRLRDFRNSKILKDRYTAREYLRLKYRINIVKKEHKTYSTTVYYSVVPTFKQIILEDGNSEPVSFYINDLMPCPFTL